MKMVITNMKWEHRIFPGITGLLAGTEYILQTGLDRIQKKEEMLMELLYEGLKKIDGIQIYGSPEGRRGPCFEYGFRWFKGFRCSLYTGKRIWDHSPRRTSLLAADPSGNGDRKRWNCESQHLLVYRGKRYSGFSDSAGQVAASLKR